jgi:hypothetical protein
MNVCIQRYRYSAGSGFQLLYSHPCSHIILIWSILTYVLLPRFMTVRFISIVASGHVRLLAWQQRVPRLNKQAAEQ